MMVNDISIMVECKTMQSTLHQAIIWAIFKQNSSTVVCQRAFGEIIGSFSTMSFGPVSAKM